MPKYEVVITTFVPYYSVRMPALESKEHAFSLGRWLKVFYPNALIEVAHDGLREGV